MGIDVEGCIKRYKPFEKSIHRHILVATVQASTFLGLGITAQTVLAGDAHERAGSL